MAKIYAYFRDGEADGECHAVEAKVIEGLSVPPERVALDSKLIYTLADFVKGAPDSYIYVYDPLDKP